MLTPKLKLLLKQAIEGNSQAYHRLQIEKLSLADTPNMLDRLRNASLIESEIVDNFLNRPDITQCSTLLLMLILNILIRRKELDNHSTTMFIKKLEDACILCVANRSTNNAGLSYVLLACKANLTLTLSKSEFDNFVLLLPPDDNDGVIAFHQAAYLTKRDDAHLRQNKIVELLQQSAKKNNEEAVLRIAIRNKKMNDLMQLGSNHPDVMATIAGLRPAAELGNFEACYVLGVLLCPSNTSANTQDAEAYFMQGVNAHNPQCMYGLAMVWLKRESSPEKLEEALELLKYAAKHFNHAPSMLRIAEYLLQRNITNWSQRQVSDYEAQQLLEKILAKDPNHVGALSLQTMIIDTGRYRSNPFANNALANRNRQAMREIIAAREREEARSREIVASTQVAALPPVTSPPAASAKKRSITTVDATFGSATKKVAKSFARTTNNSLAIDIATNTVTSTSQTSSTSTNAMINHSLNFVPPPPPPISQEELDNVLNSTTTYNDHTDTWPILLQTPTVTVPNNAFSDLLAPPYTHSTEEHTHNGEEEFLRAFYRRKG